MKNLPEKFVTRMKNLEGFDFSAYERALEEAPVKGFRVNTDKISLEEFDKIKKVRPHSEMELEIPISRLTERPLVIGAGPAGSMLAAQLADKAPHLRLALIDGSSKDNPKVCGGLLSPTAQKVFSRLGITLPTQILSDPQIFDVATMDLCSKLKRNYQRHYLNMDRYAFDRWLLSLSTG